MPFKSILRAVGRFVDAFPTPASFATKPAPQPDLQRITARRDWGLPYRPEIVDGPGSEFVPEPMIAPWDREGARYCSPLWPPQDDPYAKPEPCDIVQDPGLERVRKLTERGLVVPIGTKSDLSNVMELIERQEAAELHLRSIGMVWDNCERRWRLPDPYLA